MSAGVSGPIWHPRRTPRSLPPPNFPPPSRRSFWHSPILLFYSESRSGTSPASHRRLEPLQPALLGAAGCTRPLRSRGRSRRERPYPVHPFPSSGKPLNIVGDLPQCADSPATRRKTSPVSPFLPFPCCPLDSDQRAHNRTPNPNRYQPIECCHVTSPSQPRLDPVKLDSNSIYKFQILYWSCKINIKSSVSPKFANKIPLESLRLIESISTIKSYILWVQFETIFKLS
jgi:hypothetical protein